MKQLLGYTFLVAITIFIFPSRVSTAQIIDKQSLIAEGASVQKLGDGYSFTEGPAADTEGNVYFTDQPNNKIIRWDASTGELTVFSSASGRSNGMYFDNKGNLITCADEENQIWLFDKSGNHQVLLKEYNGKRLNGPNDLWIDPKGGMYFTDPLYKRDYWKRDPEMQQDGQHVYYRSPNGKKVVPVEKSLEKPNGIVGTPDGKHLYVADIKANKTWRYDIGKGGSLTNKKLFIEMGSDGMTLDEQGNLYLTGKGVTVFNPKGEQIAHIPIDAKWTANICFGGKDNNMLFITASEAVWGLQLNVKGAR